MTEKETPEKQGARWSAVSVKGCFVGFLRLLVVCAVLAALLPMAVCHAREEGFSCSYTPKSEGSSLFYIDIHSADAVSAAVWELSFDSSKAAYHSFSVESPDSVRVRADGDRLIAAFASASGRNGRLCRLTFKKTAVGRCDFVLTAKAAADATPALIGELNTYTLSVNLGEAGRTAAAASEKKSASTVSRGGQRSVISSLRDGDDDDTAVSDAAPEHAPGAVDLREGTAATYILLGAGGSLLLGAVGLTVFLLFRRRRNVDTDEHNTEDDLIDEAENAADPEGGGGSDDFDDEDDGEFYNFLEDEAASYPDEDSQCH